MGTESIQNAVAALLQGWLNDHPALSWCVTHPLWAIALLFLSIFLAWGFLRAIAQLLERLWIALLRAPLRLGHWIIQQIFKLFKLSQPDSEMAEASLHQPILAEDLALDPLKHRNTALLAPADSQAARFREIVARLESLQREQAQLLREVQTLLHQEPAAK